MCGLHSRILSTMNQLSPMQRIEQRLSAIPQTRAMQLQLAACDGESLLITAPLAPNINDKGSAFGGSLASIATLAAWSFVSVTLLEAGFDAEVYVQDSTIRYLAPLYDDLRAEARLATDQNWKGFLAAFAQKGKARASLIAQLHSADGGIACVLEGRFVAKAKA